MFWWLIVKEVLGLFAQIVQYPFNIHMPHVIIQVSEPNLPICGWQD